MREWLRSWWVTLWAQRNREARRILRGTFDPGGYEEADRP